MWNNTYKDHEMDGPFTKERVASGRGIIGCEMHDLNGWGEKYHCKPPRKPGLIASILGSLLSSKKNSMQP
jgi:hypothetical protein